MDPNMQWFDGYCDAKLSSMSFEKLLGPLIKEYKINLDRHISSILALIDHDDGYNNHAVILPDICMMHLLERGMPFFYITVISALSKEIGNRLEINVNISSGVGPVVLMRSNKNGKYLCAFVDGLDDDLDNNNFFVWSGDVDTMEFASLNKQTVQQMSKQTTLRAGIELLLV